MDGETALDEIRFGFGRNWQRFLAVVSEEHIAQAQRSLQGMLDRTSFSDASFLDIGSGSGLSSLSLIRLGARRVHSFDSDPQSVACTAEMKRRYAPSADQWTIERGNALDVAYLSQLGQWDIVYAWGVLHHSGAMWRALENIAPLVKDGGILYVAIYNDQGGSSRRWRSIKKFYNRGPGAKYLVNALFIPFFVARGLAEDAVHLRSPLSRYRNYKRDRGMSLLFDWFDWLGGYPFEVAKAEQIFDLYRGLGFELRRLVTKGGGWGCNEFVFTKNSSSGSGTPAA
jgi:2-polyprenyl-6-hydroxyphenyl methylase/3-demethylubiquinone-9 3-methyltransferase